MTCSPKTIPWFVSDVTPPDFLFLFKALRDRSFFTFAGDEVESRNAQYPALKTMLERWDRYLDRDVFHLAVPPDSRLGVRDANGAEFWTAPGGYWEIPMEQPELMKTFGLSNLVILKVG
jgi:hypothetical protein